MTVTDRSRILSPDSPGHVAGRDAQSANISAGQALAELLRTTLGPKGLDKMLVGTDGKVVVTNDGASMLDRLDIDQPIARVLADVASQQADRVGDGTTTAVVVAGELLAAAEDLLDRGLHPTTIMDGYHHAVQRAVETLENDALVIDASDPERLREVARTVITGKWDASATAFLAARAVETVQAIRDGQTVDFAKITRKTAPGGSVFDTQVFDGLLIDMAESSTDVVSPDPGPPRRIEDATVALVDDQLTIETVTGQGAVTVDSPAQLDAFRAYEDEVYASQVDRIAGVGADVVFCQKSIDDRVRYLLAAEGILAVERTRQDELHKLGRATGARPVASVDELTTAETGQAGVVEQQTAGPHRFTVVRDAEGFDQASLLVRGGTEHVVEEVKRLLDDCFHVLRLVVEEGRVVPGGGATEAHLARVLRDDAASVPRRDQLAIEAFADALDVIPRTLAETAGLDPVDTLLELRTRHHRGERRAGLALDTGTVTDVVDRGVVEPAAVKQRALRSAAEAANLVLRIDDVAAAASPDGDGHGETDHAHGPGELVESTEGYPWAVGHSMSHDHDH
ncbi:thermosome subunit alpha [Haloplanus aerogenes]|uniref:Chaperonin GroEL (HSP60 family) n=1 Tax=Haloplanus aerogenes TaxID=660522 RepID=A0A3M0DPU2_9EURY|nr:thermosome subunit alpha [Haloplanus aerogenes]AZH24536.1 thermosome subunit 1 [Haloplanus aerogenes]RMB23811.1 chaperonin GroEL (HSP60 family) [Haloplanus aerogenes]